MQNQKEITRINSFLSMVLPVVVNVTKRILQSLNFQVTEKGHGLDTVFTIKAGFKYLYYPFAHNIESVYPAPFFVYYTSFPITIGTHFQRQHIQFFIGKMFKNTCHFNKISKIVTIVLNSFHQFQLILNQ